MTDQPADPATPTRGPTRGTFLAVTLLLSALWLVIFGQLSRRGWQAVWAETTHTRAAAQLARLELHLRALEVRACTARTGALPVTLAACEGDATAIVHLVEWALEEAAPSDHVTPAGYGVYGDPQVIAEPWSLEARVGVEDASPPAAWQDYFGLPILYRPGVQELPGAGWIHSADEVPEVLQSFLQARGEPIPPEAPQPFALGSLFLERCARDLSQARQRAVLLTAVCWGGLGVIWLMAIVTLVMIRRPSGWRSKLAAGVAAVVSALVLLGGLGVTVTCYVIATFTSRELSRQERLQLLEEGVQQGEIPAPVAQQAREFIQGLPE